MQSDQQDSTTTQCWVSPIQAIVGQTIYKWTDLYAGTFLSEFDAVKESYEFNKKRYGKTVFFGDYFQRYNENRLVEHCLILMETANAMQETRAAKEIQKRALELLDDSRLRSALPEALV